MAAANRWTREELLVVLNLYGKLRFGQFHSKQPVIVDVAARMGRTPGSLAMKLSNFASLQRANGVWPAGRLTGSGLHECILG